MKIKAKRQAFPRKTFYCPVHPSSALRYSPADMRWECPVLVCEYLKFPEVDKTGGRLVVGHGHVELLVVTDRDHHREFFLRTMDDNLALQVTDIIQPLTPGASAEDVIVSLRVKNIVFVDQTREART